MLTLIALAVVVALLYRATTAEARRAAAMRVAREVMKLQATGRRQLDPFYSALRERQPRALVTIAIAAVDIAVFIGLVFGRGALSDPQTLISWGASFGPRTTNGEWWRLLTASFVHDGLFGLLFDVTAIVQIGSMLERLAGRAAFSAAYVIGAVFAGLVTLSGAPMATTSGSGGAIAALFGALVVCAVRSWRGELPIAVPRAALGRCLATLAFVFIHELAGGSTSMTAALAAIAGAVVFTVFCVSEEPDPRRLVYAIGTFVLITGVGAFMLNGIIDVRPELAHLVSVEQRTSDLYRTARTKTAGAKLAAVIDANILPELAAADEHLASLRGVPAEDRHKVDDAREYLKLRRESWRLRASALRASAVVLPETTDVSGDPAAAFRARATARYRADMRTLGQAETAERAALETLARLKTDD